VAAVLERDTREIGQHAKSASTVSGRAAWVMVRW
jgi:hypothetical protein